MACYSNNSEGTIYQILWSDTYLYILLGYVADMPADLQELQKYNSLQCNKCDAYWQIQSNLGSRTSLVPESRS
jgi:hypothetical protein